MAVQQREAIDFFRYIAGLRAHQLQHMLIARHGFRCKSCSSFLFVRIQCGLASARAIRDTGPLRVDRAAEDLGAEPDAQRLDFASAHVLAILRPPVTFDALGG
jgi:hypothetical protein